MTDEALLSQFRWEGYDLPEDCEERMSPHGFTDYAFYQSPERDVRVFCFSCCGAETVVSSRKRDGRYNADLADVKHGRLIPCPFCGRAVLVKCLGRLRGGDEGGFPSLRESRNVALLDALGDTLLISAGRLYRRWYPSGEVSCSGWPGELVLDYPWPEAETRLDVRRRYALRLGTVRAWRKEEIWEYRHLVGHDWAPVKRPGVRPFPLSSVMNNDPEDGQYTTIGTEAVANTGLRYCSIDRYLAEDGRVWADGVYGRDTVGYLLEYVRHPQLEMLVKLGHSDVIDDLLRGERNGGLLNWRTTTPQGFFRRSRGEYRVFRAAGGTLAELRQVQEAKGLGVPLDMYFAEKTRLTKGLCYTPKDAMHDCGTLAQTCGVSLHTAVSYAIRHGGTDTWRDYIAAAQRLGYDLTRRDVALPKDLRQRHDEAAAALRTRTDQRQTERYQKTILPALRRKYECQLDGLRIVVPLSAEEIVAEGKAMAHCVGGYAARHIQGRVTILFLRRAERPEEPFVTIEMNGETLVQARGYRNDWDVDTTPLPRHPAFFAAWLDWVRSGSPRMQDGTPVLTDRKETKPA